MAQRWAEVTPVAGGGGDDVAAERGRRGSPEASSLTSKLNMLGIVLSLGEKHVAELRYTRRPLDGRVKKVQVGVRKSLPSCLKPPPPAQSWAASPVT